MKKNKKKLKLDKVEIAKLQQPKDIFGGKDPFTTKTYELSCLFEHCNSTLTDPIDGGI